MTEKKPLKIAIASGKGGTGKTLLATNLAAWLAISESTLLVDLDVEEPNDFIFITGNTESITDQFKMIPGWDASKCSLCGNCSAVCKYHAVVKLGTMIAVFDELCHSCYACSELCPENALPMKPRKMGEISNITAGNLTFLESRLRVGEEQAVPLINKTHSLVKNEFMNFTVQIFDCPPGTTCPVIAATKHTDFVILVTEPTPFGLNDLKLAVETIQQLKKPMGVVINRFGMGDQGVEEFCVNAGIPVLARIPFSRKIAGLYSSGTLVYDKIEGFDRAMKDIVQFIQKSISNA